MEADGKRQKIIARFRLGCEEATSKYWLAEDKKCRICKIEEVFNALYKTVMNN